MKHYFSSGFNYSLRLRDSISLTRRRRIARTSRRDYAIREREAPYPTLSRLIFRYSKTIYRYFSPFMYYFYNYERFANYPDSTYSSRRFAIDNEAITGFNRRIHSSGTPYAKVGTKRQSGRWEQQTATASVCLTVSF